MINEKEIERRKKISSELKKTYLSGEYKRDINDWVRLCKKCHVAYDDSINKGWATRRQYAD